jgi:hypothetical protein
MLLHSAAIASAAEIASAEPALLLPTLLRHKDFHLAAGLQTCRTDELIDKQNVESRKRARETTRLAVTEQTKYR